MWACGLLSRIGCPRFNRVTFSKFQTTCIIWRIYKPMKCYMKIHTTPLFPFYIFYAHTTSIWTNTYTAYTTVLRPSFYPTCGQHPVSYGVPAVAVGNNGTSVKRSNSLKHNDFYPKKNQATTKSSGKSWPKKMAYKRYMPLKKQLEAALAQTKMQDSPTSP